MRVDVRDVAEPGQEQPAEAVPMIAAADGEPEDLYRILLLMCRRVGGPGVSGFGAVEVVAPECLLIAAPAQPSFIAGAVDGGEAAVKKTGVNVREARGWPWRRGRERGSRCGLRAVVANDERSDDKGEAGDDSAAHECDSRQRHCN